MSRCFVLAIGFQKHVRQSGIVLGIFQFALLVDEAALLALQHLLVLLLFGFLFFERFQFELLVLQRNKYELKLQSEKKRRETYLFSS